MEHLEPSDLEARLTAGTKLVLLDVREPWEFATCRIPGSINIPMAGVPGALQTLDPGTAVVTVCHHGVRSAQVADFLERQGFGRVANLEGGVDAWAREVDPQMPRY